MIVIVASFLLSILIATFIVLPDARIPIVGMAFGLMLSVKLIEAVNWVASELEKRSNEH